MPSGDPRVVHAPIAPLKPISLAQLQQQGGELELQVLQPLAELEDAEPVQGWIRLRHLRTALEVEGEVSTTLACRCDRCLRPFQLPLRAAAHERLAINPGGSPCGDADLNGQLALASWLDDDDESLDLRAWLGEDPEECLDPQGSFDAEHWLFEQLSLQLPLVYRCGPDCPGPALWSSASELPDRRWQALRQLQQDGD